MEHPFSVLNALLTEIDTDFLDKEIFTRFHTEDLVVLRFVCRALNSRLVGKPHITDDTDVCDFAARHGHIRILAWARASGCPCDRWTWFNAMMGDQLAAVIWLDRRTISWHGPERHRRNKRDSPQYAQYKFVEEQDNHEIICRMAIRSGHLHLLRWICWMHLDYPTTDTAFFTASLRQANMLRWLQQEYYYLADISTARLPSAARFATTREYIDWMNSTSDLIFDRHTFQTELFKAFKALDEHSF